MFLLACGFDRPRMAAVPVLVLGFALLCIGSLAESPPAALPPELGHLRMLMEDEASLASAIRVFDRKQHVLYLADRARAEVHAKAGQESQADARRETARERLALIRRAYEIGLRRYPENAGLHNYYGELLYDGYGKETAALEEWKTALSFDPALSSAHNNIGLLYFHGGDYKQGLEHLDRALDQEPDNPDYLFNLVQVYLIHAPQIQEIRGWSPAKIYDEAMDMSRKAAKVSPEDYELLQDYAVNFFAAERFDAKVRWSRAAKAWRQARERARNEDERFYTWLNEARAWIKASKEKDAIECLDAALKIRPGSDVAKNLRTKCEEGL